MALCEAARDEGGHYSKKRRPPIPVFTVNKNAHEGILRGRSFLIL